ncbi:MAG TPA: hypothetical protein VLG68_10095 [Gammaproteobacteria bacterium]|nr:hypothetical protein [Gammaproteobacteria bacterium]
MFSSARRPLWAGLFIACHLVLFQGTATAAQASWQSVRSSVTMRALATDGSLYVAAAGNGIWTSTDLKTWQRATLPTSAGGLYNDVTWDGSQFIAVGYGVVTSPDGTTWTMRSRPNGPSFWNAISVAGGIYLVVGTDGSKVLRSTDGQTWTAVGAHLSLPANSFVSLTGIGSNGSGFIASGIQYQLVGGVTTFEGDALITSSDGLTWSLQTLPSSGFDFFDTQLLNDVAYGAGLYVAGGANGQYTSPDAATWSENFIPSLSSSQSWYFSRTAYLNGKFVATGTDYTGSFGRSSAVFTSTDGINWLVKDLEPRGASVFSMSSLLYSGGQYIAAGYAGVYSSSNGATWKKVFTGPETNLNACVIQGNGRFVIPGEFGTISSSDGATWPEALREDTNLLAETSGQGCGAFGAGVFVVLDIGNADISWSTDGASWTGASVPFGATYTGVAWTGSQFVAIGSIAGIPSIISSTDGKTWTNKGSISTSGATANLGDGFSGDLAYLNGKLVAWGTLNGVPFVATSSDAVTWAVSTSGLTSNVSIGSVAYGANNYVAVGNDPNGVTTVFTSPDAVHWTLVSNVAPNTNTSWRTVIWGNNEFLAGGRDNRVGYAVYMTSADGIAWHYAVTSEAAMINDVVWDGTQYVTASYYDVLRMVPQSSGSGGGGSNGGGSGGGGNFGLGLLGLLAGFAALRRRCSR